MSSGHEKVRIAEVLVDDEGKLSVRPEPLHDFSYVYRAAMGVHWDEERRCLYSPAPREWSYTSGYRQIVAAVLSEYGIRLVPTEHTSLRNLPPEVQEHVRQSIEQDMHSELKAEVLAIDAFDELEREHIADVLTWIDSGAELCRISKPATPPKHLVSYFVLVDAEHVLLVDHKNAQLWLPTGGHVEPGEHPRATVARELREELGIELEHELDPPLMLTCTSTVGRTAGHTDVSLWYVVNEDRNRSLQWDTDEFNSVRWFSFTEAPITRSDPHLGRFLRKLSLTSRSTRR